MIGTLLANRYRIDSKLGEGGMGIVYKAHDTLLDRAVAIKTLSPALLGEEGTKRLMREAQSAAKLTHPNIVGTYDVIEEGDARLIVMEYVEGRTLRDLIPLPWTQAAQIVAQVCRALEYAHARGIVHRDIKPENIIFTADGTPKVMDFGLARSEGRSRLTQTGMLVGTVAYMAPEQALRGEADARSDLYALGCVLYEAITGHPPFEAEDPIAVITQHINIPPVAPRFHTAGIPDTLERVILKLLAKDPEARYRSARDTALALEAVHESAIQAAPQPKVVGPELVQAVRRGILVGRDEDLSRLKSLLDEAVSGEGRLVLVSGEAGVGKTRLVEELITYAHLRGVRVLSVKCYEGGTPYEPMTRMLRDYLRLASADEVRTALGDYAVDLVRLIPELRQKIGALPESVDVPPDQERARLFEAFTKLFSEGAQTALLLFVDDIHLGDPSSFQLLRYLAPAIAGTRVLLVTVHRSEEIDRNPAFAEFLKQLRRERHATSIELKALTQEQVGELIRTMAKHPTTPVKFANRIYESTEGNPYFIEEVINALFEQGTLYIKDGQWSTDFDETGRYNEMPVPTTISSTIEARLERLSEPCRQALTHAAILGRHFQLEILAKIMEVTEDQLVDLLEEAVRARLIREARVAGEDRFEFTQSMIREVLYGRILRHRRRRMHLRAAEAMEQLYGTHHGWEGALSDHFLEAGEEERAIPYLVAAGEHAESVFAHDEAIQRFETARALLEDSGRTEEATGLFERLGDPYLRSGQVQKAIESYDQALRFYDASGEKLKTAHLRSKIGAAHRENWNFTDAIPVLEQALEDFGNQQTPEVLMTYLTLARAYNFSGEPGKGMEWAKRTLAMATASGATDEAAMALIDIGVAHGFQDQLDDAITYYKEAIKLASQSKSFLGKSALRRAINNLGVVEATRGDFRGALEAFQQAVSLSEELRTPRYTAFMLDNVAGTLFELGDWEGARAIWNRILAMGERAGIRFHEATMGLLRLDENREGLLEELRVKLAAAEARRDVQAILESLVSLAEVSLYLKDIPQAEQHARRASEQEPRPTPIRLLAEILARQGRTAEAATVCDHVEDYYRKIKATGRMRGIYHVRGLIGAAEGHRDEAVQHFREAIRIADEYPAPYQQARVFEDLAALYQGHDRAQALESYHRALATYERLGAKRSANRVREHIAQLQTAPT